MRGFETGLFLRTKGGSIEEYGCAGSLTSDEKINDSVFKQIKSAIKTATAALKLDPVIKETFDVILEFLDGFSALIDVLSPSKHRETDMYCTGMIFGLQGSKILVKVANSIGEKKELPSDADVLGFFENLGKGIFRTATNTYEQAKAARDEL